MHNPAIQVISDGIGFWLFFGLFPICIEYKAALASLLNRHFQLRLIAVRPCPANKHIAFLLGLTKRECFGLFSISVPVSGQNAAVQLISNGIDSWDKRNLFPICHIRQIPLCAFFHRHFQLRLIAVRPCPADKRIPFFGRVHQHKGFRFFGIAFWVPFHCPAIQLISYGINFRLFWLHWRDFCILFPVRGECQVPSCPFYHGNFCLRLCPVGSCPALKGIAFLGWVLQGEGLCLCRIGGWVPFHCPAI